MPNGKYDFEYDEPVSIPLDPETTLRALLSPVPPDTEEQSPASEESAALDAE